MGYRIINGRAYPIGNFEALPIDKNVSKKVKESQVTFKEVLDEVSAEKYDYTLSKHAAERLSQINFTNDDMKVIGDGFKLAEDKGSKNSVMIYKDVALIASIENKTVITAIEKDRAKENVFTNVDSVVIL
jgi:flagellar operon protein